jgi:hypothetical protein
MLPRPCNNAAYGYLLVECRDHSHYCHFLTTIFQIDSAVEIKHIR